MRKVRILKPFDGYAVGDTPEVFGQRARELVASGHAERVDDEAKPRKKGKGN
jgi:hypothetical protein